MAEDVLRFAGVPADRLDGDAAKLAIARDHWYADWADALAHGNEPVDTRFEAAADAVHAGDLGTLRRLLDAHPALITAPSPFPHRQTLLHYVAANGVEVERQQRSPANAVEVLRLLLARGADPDATCASYGGGMTTLCLLVSSAGPAAAGVDAALVEELCRGGAGPDGIDEDGRPLWTAITSGHTAAAEALARSGARVDNLCFAAALGELDQVRRYIEDGITPPERMGARGPRLAPQRAVEYALIWAAAHDRRAVARFLLGKNPDLRFTEPLFGATALGAARYHGNREMAALLEAHTGRLRFTHPARNTVPRPRAPRPPPADPSR
ncbi:hypothetical protein HFP15_21415 [Amycolatopsis sp. K13G38]|uniref:Ankyrin repeat domain-containing protein n=1 Tax=Amycolatopsis acididurans TaxID=2724524 RepID=A0ABX1J6N3_9PSEU|nr:hypothetical protein [Amycolatopsis acididurans]NKQ55446.1 hypothetical protein [Amycolatopsis acididurans]